MDISRASHDARKHYDATRSLQGRLLTDDDLNVADLIAKEDRRLARLDAIGPQGSPDDGFAITAAGLTGGGEIDFHIDAGTMYVSGLRVPMDPDGEQFIAQRDWLQQQPADRRPVGSAPRTDLVVLEVWQQPVEAVEDAELIEPALGGIDTSARIRTMRRVHVAGGLNQTACDAAWKAFAASVGGVDADGALHTDSRLTVTMASDGVSSDLCSPQVTGGFLGALNQAIRVELVSPTSLVWGFDNGAPLYRAVLAGTKVQLPGPPRDQAHWPAVGQVVELIAWSAILPNGEKLAETRIPLSPPAGSPPLSLFARVTTAFAPDDSSFSIDVAPPAGFNAGWQGRYPAGSIDHNGNDTYVFLRIWNRGADLSALPATFTPSTAFPLIGTGLNVTINGTVPRPGDYWVIAARPRTPIGVVPWQLLSGAPPVGPQRWYAPLGLLGWTAGSTTPAVHDCRARMHRLTDQIGCCALSVSPGSGWERVFANLPAGQDVSICFAPGVYPVTQTIEVANLGNVMITGAGQGTKLQGPTVETVLRFSNCANVVMRDLFAETGAAGAGAGSALQHLNGTLTFVDCAGVTTEALSLRCAAADRRAAACLTVRCPTPRKATRAGPPSVRIRGCDLGIGHLQVGILVIDADRASIVDNSLAVVDPDSPLNLTEELSNAAFRRRLRDSLISQLQIDRPAAAGANITLSVGGRSLSFVSAPNLASAWQTAVAAKPPPASLSFGAVHRYIYGLANAVLQPAAPSRPGFAGWLQLVAKVLRPVASQGIVVTGRRAGDIHIAGNTVDGAVTGVHLGLSHKGQPRVDPGDQAGRVRIADNRVTVRCTVDAVRARRGIFVSGCDSLVVDGNHVAVERTEAGVPRPVEGIRADGRMGSLVLIQRNHLAGCTTGVVLWVPRNQAGIGAQVLWKISENIAPDAPPTQTLQLMAGTTAAPNGLVEIDDPGPDRNKPRRPG